MKVLNAEAIRQWDQFTIDNEPIPSFLLMERAATKCVAWLEGNHFKKNIKIYCGKGNNGGDGLAIARMLFQKNCSVSVYILEFGNIGTTDFQANLQKLHEYEIDIFFIQNETHFHEFEKNDLIIDCLLGSGLNRPLEGVTKKLVEHINASDCEIIAIDIPTGLSADHSSKGNTAIKAAHTLSFQCYKPAFLVPENSENIGHVHILDIGLHPGYYDQLKTNYELTGQDLINTIYKPRGIFSHKGNFGHALLVAGSYGKIGAAVLATKACLRSGAGLVTTHLPACGYQILQTAVPEAMVMTNENKNINTSLDADLSKYNSIGIGPGIGTADETKSLLQKILSDFKKPIVADADALNIIAAHHLFSLIAPGSILTPHPKEFERLFGTTKNDFERIELAQQKAKELKIVIVLKGHYTFIALPDGPGYFNSTGNVGMATGGTGDALTGILTGLLAQNYQPSHAAILGVYLHGLAGDIAAKQFSQESLIAGDIVTFLSDAFHTVSSKFKK
jgi:ADP-dependent NAD(P)H-hydrate dehydratase / NAD(P)H-hydrate epimerase